jgi:aspartate/methionine/tyrosine aminotransferase
MTNPYISPRAASNLVHSRLGEVRSHCFHNAYDLAANPDGIIALAIAENKLMRDEIASHINQNFNINPWHLTYGNGSTGSNKLKQAVAKFMNKEFRPLREILASHICICNGAGSAVDNLCFCAGEPGDGILIGRPLYTGFFPDIEARAQTKPVLVPFDGIDPLSPEAVQCYEQALLEFNASHPGNHIRAVLLSSPHNPLGRPYSKEALIECLKLCGKHNIHLFSDEVYCKSSFPSQDFPVPAPFISVLSLPIEQYCNPALVHVIYGMSKDFCANGIRLGCLVSPFNKKLLSSFKAVSSLTRASQLAEHIWLNLLDDHKFLEWYFPELERRMTDAYEYITSLLQKRTIPYSKASVSSFLWIDLSRYLRIMPPSPVSGSKREESRNDKKTSEVGNEEPRLTQAEEQELALNWRFAKAGVWVGMGASFAADQPGWIRITFASPREEVKIGMKRMFQVLDEIDQETEMLHR